jgi:hypothetical protein
MVLAVVVMGLGEMSVRAQQTSTNALVSATNTTRLSDPASIKLPEHPTLELRLPGPADTNNLEYSVSKTTKVNISGPLVRVGKAKNASDLGHRVFSLINPFSSEEPNVPAAAAGPVNTRAWSTIVGYSPGRSAFPDGAWHEPPHLDLISVRMEKQQQP